ncbi:MAG: hypothetical protein Q9218_004441, partial [Villophora microphyllina]
MRHSSPPQPVKTRQREKSMRTRTSGRLLQVRAVAKSKSSGKKPTEFTGYDSKGIAHHNTQAPSGRPSPVRAVPRSPQNSPATIPKVVLMARLGHHQLYSAKTFASKSSAKKPAEFTGYDFKGGAHGQTRAPSTVFSEDSVEIATSARSVVTNKESATGSRSRFAKIPRGENKKTQPENITQQLKAMATSRTVEYNFDSSDNDDWVSPRSRGENKKTQPEAAITVKERELALPARAKAPSRIPRPTKAPAKQKAPTSPPKSRDEPKFNITQQLKAMATSRTVEYNYDSSDDDNW